MMKRRRRTNRNASTPLTSALCGAAWLLCCYTALYSVPRSLAADTENSSLPRQSQLDETDLTSRHLIGSETFEEFSKFMLQPRQSLKGEAGAAVSNLHRDQSRLLKRDVQYQGEPAQQKKKRQKQLIVKRQRGYQRTKHRGQLKKKFSSNQYQKRRGNPPGINQKRNNYNNRWKNKNGGKPSGQTVNSSTSWNSGKLCPCPGWQSTKWWGGRKLFYGSGYWGGRQGYSYGAKGGKVRSHNEDTTWWGGNGGQSSWSRSSNSAWWSTWSGTYGWNTGSNSWSATNNWNARSNWGVKWCPCPTDPPSNKPTELQTYAPTKIPTYKPTPAVAAPSQIPSGTPTYRPTEAPDLETCEWFFWGADESRGGTLADNQNVPYLYDWPTVADLSSGSRHIFIIEKKGNAEVSGFVESKAGYRGHLGIKNWVQGSNSFTPVDEVAVYINGTTDVEKIPAPRFTRVFAGAGTPGDARAMHSIFISEDGDVFTTGNNHKGQLCLGDQENRYVPHHVPDLPAPAVSASVGLDFTLILLENGQVFGCGSNQNGEIGLGKKIHHSLFAAEIIISNTTEAIVDISTGWAFSLFQDEAGQVFGTGSNLFSQMCKTTEGDPLFEAELIEKVSDVEQIFAGSESSYFLGEDGDVKACGRNDQGQLGDGSFLQRDRPVNVRIPKGEKIKLIGSGPSAASVFFAGEDPGVMFATGINDRLQLGLNANNVAAESTPAEVDFGEDAELYNFTKVSASGTNTAAIACVLNTPTQTPTAYPTDEPTAMPTDEPTSEPTMIPTDEPTAEPTLIPTSEPTAEPTSEPTMIPTDEPTVITEEPTSEPTMIPTDEPTADPTSEPTLIPTSEPTTESPTAEPTIITEEPTSEPTSEPTTEAPTLAPTSQPRGWWFWGGEEGKAGVLGENQQVPLLFEDEVIDLSAGSRHSFLIQSDGAAFAAGFIESDFGYKGHLGVDDWEEGSNEGKQIDEVIDLSGEKVEAPPFLKAYAGAGVPSDSGEMHSMLIDQEGNVYTTGRNSKGQLCLGDNEDRFEFTQVDGLPKPAIAGTVGFEFTLILLEDGTVWGCGSNEFGELGLGSKVDFTNVPDKGNGLKNIQGLASGYKFSIFLDDDNVVYGTGGNIYGQQCFFTEGEPATDPTPDILSDVKGTVIQVAANRESSYFLLDDGTAVSCGRNDEGQLGDGTLVNTSEDEPIVTVQLEDILKIGTGPSAQTVFFVTEGKVYGAGLNDRYQLGIDKIGSEEAPVKVKFEGEVNIDLISASGTHSLASGTMAMEMNAEAFLP